MKIFTAIFLWWLSGVIFGSILYQREVGGKMRRSDWLLVTTIFWPVTGLFLLVLKMFDTVETIDIFLTKHLDGEE